MNYKKYIYSDGTHKMLKIHDDGHEQWVDDDHNELLDWLALGNEPEIVEVQPTPEPTNEEKWNNIRARRNQLISETDWTMLLDSPLTSEKKEQYVVYRQALRDITNPKDENGNPINNLDDIVFPTL